MYNMAKLVEIIIPTVIGISGIGLAIYYNRKSKSFTDMSSHSLVENLGYSKSPTVSDMGFSDPEFLDPSERGSSFVGSDQGSFSSDYYSAEEGPTDGGRKKKTKRKKSKNKTKKIKS